MAVYINFKEAIHDAAVFLLEHGEAVDTRSWQGKESKDEFTTLEVINYLFTCPINPSVESLEKDIRPNLPWAREHFFERACGEPLNPGKEYKNWPFYKKDEFRTGPNGKFTHTYMERFWTPAHPGIRYAWGNLNDVINLLGRDPLTRQAYFPVWFPEDTGASHRGRVPCTLGYYFLCRDNRLHIFYPIRSCDLLRHFQDDIYLACRLLLWVLGKLQGRSLVFWLKVSPGDLTMHVYSLHIFKEDFPILKYKLEKGVL